MPSKACHVMDERVRFVARLLDGEKMAVLCEEFGAAPAVAGGSVGARTLISGSAQNARPTSP